MSFTNCVDRIFVYYTASFVEEYCKRSLYVKF